MFTKYTNIHIILNIYTIITLFSCFNSWELSFAIFKFHFRYNIVFKLEKVLSKTIEKIKNLLISCWVIFYSTCHLNLEFSKFLSLLLLIELMHKFYLFATSPYFFVVVKFCLYLANRLKNFKKLRVAFKKIPRTEKKKKNNNNK